MSSRFGHAVVTALLGSLLASAGVVAAAWGWFDQQVLAELPDRVDDLRDFRPLTAVQILDRDGQVADSFYLERRFWVSIDDLPDHVWQAFIAAEDQHFFEHPGIDLTGILRPAATTLRWGSRRGGSTLTQQLVKNLLLTPERSYERKLKEAVLAWRLERELDKREILQLYLNFVFLGSGNYGVEAAARDYFGVSAKDLDPGEAALLAGLVPAPSRYTPRRSPELAKSRRSYVLGRMVDEGYIDAVDAIDYDDAPVIRAEERGAGEIKGDPTAYVTTVRREIRRLFGPEEPFERGLRVHTPYDPDVQHAAIEATSKAITDHLERQGPRAIVDRAYAGAPPPDPEDSCFVAQVPRDRDLTKLVTASRRFVLRPGDRMAKVFDERDGIAKPLAWQLRGGELLGVCREGDSEAVALDRAAWAQAAAVVIENATGRVVALTGGTDTTIEGFVRATQARRQPGSSFKPYVYGAALDAGRTQVDLLNDAPLYLPAGGGKTWSPKNYGGGFAGQVPMRRAMASSLNTVAVRLALEVGPTQIAHLARSLGVRTPLRTDLTMALGSSEVTPLDQAVAYASIARLGVPIDPVFVDRVEDGDGRTLADAGGSLRLADGTEVVLPGRPGARVLDAGVAYELLDVLREVVKGGTARRAYVEGYDRAGKTGTTNNNVDAWFVGMTPLYSVAVWIGTDGTGTLGDKETGGRAALPAWIAIVEALPDQQGLVFPVPDEAVRVETSMGLLAFERGRVPSNVLPTARTTAAPLPELPR